MQSQTGQFHSDPPKHIHTEIISPGLHLPLLNPLALGRIVAPDGVHVRISGTCGQVPLAAKGALQVWLGIWRCKDGLDRPGGPDVISGIL